jgi:hypothetical protein
MKRVYTLSYDHICGPRTLANLTLEELTEKLNQIEDDEFIIKGSVVVSTQEVKV